MILIILSILSLPLMAVCYFYSKLKMCFLFALVFFIANIMLAHGLFYEHHAFFFYFLITLCVAFPVSCLIAFAFDVRYAIFCIDTSFSLMIAWAFSPIMLPINLIVYFLK